MTSQRLPAWLRLARSFFLRLDFGSAQASRPRRLAGVRFTGREGLFHVFNDEDRLRYVEGLAKVLKPGGKLFLLCFSDEEPGTQGPRRVFAKEIRDAFADGWTVESIEPSRFEVRSDFVEMRFSEGGPKAWFVVVRKEK